MFKKKAQQTKKPASQDVTVVNKGTIIEGEVTIGARRWLLRFSSL